MVRELSKSCLVLSEDVLRTSVPVGLLEFPEASQCNTQAVLTTIPVPLPYHYPTISPVVAITKLRPPKIIDMYNYPRYLHMYHLR